MIFQRRLDPWRCRFSPRVENFFGSAAGKYKYDVGIKAEVEGFLPWDLFYDSQVSYTVLSDIDKLQDYDRYNPSQLPIVATDYVRYRQESAFTIDKLYLQKAWNLNHGCFSRAAGGYFQVNYGGVAGELLWYPPNSLIALGLEGAVVMKRNYSGLGFQRTLRKRKGMVETFRSYSTLQQYSLDLYVDFPAFQIFTKASVGQFLAYDKGARLEATRYFDNGLKITGWITFTDAYDMVNGEKYYDRGIALEVPFDFFYKCSSKRVWNHALAAWLRDAGYKTTTGVPLFEILNRERRW